MVHRPAVAISCGALLIAAMAGTSYYVRTQQKAASQATVESGVVLLPGETLVSPPDPVVARTPATTQDPAPAPVKPKPGPTTPKYRKQSPAPR